MFGKKKTQAQSSAEYDDYGYNDDTSYDDYGDTQGVDDYGVDDYGDGGYGGDDYPTTPVNTKKKKKGGNKGGNPLGKILGAVVVIAVICAVFFAVTSVIGPRKGECKEVIETAQSGFNNLDPQQVTSVLNPSIRTKIDAILLLTQVVTDESASEILTTAVNYLGSGLVPGDLEASEFFKQVELEPYKFGLPGSSRKVTCRVKINGTTYQNVIITIKKSHGEAYIDKVRLAK